MTIDRVTQSPVPPATIITNINPSLVQLVLKTYTVDRLPEETLNEVKRVISLKHRKVFVWPHNDRTFDLVFHRIQRAADINLPCKVKGKHECTDACHVYGMHDLRRSYATENAERLSAKVLQKKMRHRSITTTMGYIDVADKLKNAAEDVYVPDVGQLKAAN